MEGSQQPTMTTTTTPPTSLLVPTTATAAATAAVVATATATATAALLTLLSSRWFDASGSWGGWDVWERSLSTTSATTTPPRAVLITGAGTGLGRAAALALARSSASVTVFAGVMNDAEAAELSAAARHTAHMRPLLLDVTRDDHVRAAVDAIRASGLALQAVVSNANLMGAPGPLEQVDPADATRCFEVNCAGALRVVRACLPLLRAVARSSNATTTTMPPPRIVFVSSGAGQLAVPFHGVYAMCKHATEAAADVLRRELRHEGIAVTVVQPSMIRTEAASAWPTLLERKWTPDTEAKYGSLRPRVVRQHVSLVDHALTPEQAARAVVHASVCEGRPPTRYRVGASAWAVAVISLLPASVADWVVRVAAP